MDAGDVEDIYELSPLQQGILFHSLFDDDAAVYVNQRSFLIEGPLDIDTLLAACLDTVHAHPSLRTTFHWDGLDKPLQVVHRSAALDVQRYDWAGVEDHQEKLDALLAADLATGFDPAVAPLQRLLLVELAPDRYVFVWTHHLLVLDGWSVPIFLGEVLQRYFHRMLGTPAPPPAPPYRDYIAWLQRQDLGAAERFWARTLPSDTDAATLAPLLPVEPSRPSGEVRERIVDVPEHLDAGLRACAARHGVTLNTVLHAAWALVLQRYGGGRSVTFGVTSSCRPPELPQVERMLGLFTNTLPVRVTVPADGAIGPWLREVQAGYAAVRRVEYSPLAQIKQWTGTPGSEPLFRSLVIFDNYAMGVDLGGLTGRLSVRLLDAVEKTSEPLVLIAIPGPPFTVRVRYHEDRFGPGVAEEILDCFRATLAAMVDAGRIADVAAASAPPVHAVLGHGPRLDHADVELTLVDLLERQTYATHAATALVAGELSVPYDELMIAARCLATALAAAGVRPGDVVGVCAERSPDMVVGILAALYAGAAYLPLDPALPSARLGGMLRDAGADVVVAQPGTAAAARETGARRVLTGDDAAEVLAPLPALRPDDPAYVMHTSGSSGRPKGVVITHRAIVNRLLWMQETFGLTPADRVLQKTPFGFDVSVWEFFWPLMTGAAIVLARPGGHQDAEYLAATIGGQGVTTAHFVPSMLGLFLDEPGTTALGGLRRVVCSGEALPPAMVARFRERLPHVELHNLYGPTEAAVDVTWWDCARPTAPDVLPIGDPIANTQAIVMDDRLSPVPDSVPGELYLGGVQLATGYAGRPGLTAATFVAHPLAGPGQRLYRTGDRVRRLPGGALEYLGRLDHQVKINGYRIELGEVEQVLASHPAVREAVVVVRDRADGRHLAAYVTPAGDAPPDPRQLREHLQELLPVYMLPASITPLEALPLSRNGKLDRAALPDPAAVVAGAATIHRPQTPGETAVAAVFQDILGIDAIDVTADFFTLGGNSFDAVRAIRRLEGATVGLLGAHPSVRELAAALDEQAGDRLLLRMSPPGCADHTLVCVPFGGGSAITYQQLARALPERLAVLTVSPPGHEIGGDPELRPLEDVAQEAVDEVLRTVEGPISVYGHCAGVGLAVEIVRRLEESGRRVDRLFLGGSYPFYEFGRFGRMVQRGLFALVGMGLMKVSAATVGTTSSGGPTADRAEMRYLKSIGGFQGELADEELMVVMRAFRHDVSCAARYFSQRWTRDAPTPPLAAPITVLAGTADPLTPEPERRYTAWRRFTGDVELVTIPDGGHYFHQHQPDLVAAELVRRCADLVPTEGTMS